MYVDCLFLPITNWDKHVLEGWKCMGMIQNQMDFLPKKTKQQYTPYVFKDLTESKIHVSEEWAVYARLTRGGSLSTGSWALWFCGWSLRACTGKQKNKKTKNKKENTSQTCPWANVTESFLQLRVALTADSDPNPTLNHCPPWLHFKDFSVSVSG